eukprot:gene24910-33403_t
MNEEFQIQPFFADKVQCNRQYIYDTGIIAEGTLLLPYAGVNIDGIVEDIIAASKRSPSAPRSKYLMVTLRGVGGGKTRMIEETRIRMGVLYPNCFAENLIVGTVRHIAGRVRKVNPSIDSMVLFIDEPVKLIEDKRFPEDGFDDGYAFL